MDKLDSNFSVRPLAFRDLNEDYFKLMSQLTDSPYWNVSLREWNVYKHSNKCIVVTVDKKDKIVGTASIFFEKKFTRGGSTVGHIEDVVVDVAYRKKSIALTMLNFLRLMAKGIGAYKLILNCSDDNIDFYTKCGFYKHENEMRLDI